MVSVVLDGTPLLGPRTGVGRYTEHLLTELVRLPGEPVLSVAATAFTWRGSASLAGALPPGVRAAARRAPARLLQAAWARSEWPPAEWLTGRVDLVHATNFVLPPLRSARGVVTVHDLAYLRLPDTVSSASARYRELVPRGLRRAALVLTPSEAVAAEVREEYRLPADRVVATQLGVESIWQRTAPPSASWLASRGLPPRYLLFVGTVEPRKDLPTLLAAYRELLGEPGLDVPPLVLVGPSGWGPALDTAGLPAGAVVPAGYLDASTLRVVVAGAAALCFPSLYEGFGLPPLEALAAGTPVVASDIPTTREVAGDLVGSAVRLAPAGDAAAFAGCLAAALTTAYDPAPGRARAAAFTWRRTAGRTRDAYRRALE